MFLIGSQIAEEIYICDFNDDNLLKYYCPLLLPIGKDVKKNGILMLFSPILKSTFQETRFFFSRVYAPRTMIAKKMMYHVKQILPPSIKHFFLIVTQMTQFRKNSNYFQLWKRKTCQV